jgi:hypothetical protein
MSTPTYLLTATDIFNAFWYICILRSVYVQNRTYVYMNFFDHKDLGNHLLQFCPKVVKHPVYTCVLLRIRVSWGFLILAAPTWGDYATIYVYFFPLWFYSPNLGLGRLHETFHFISVTRSRTVSSIPWTGDQLVARRLLTAPGDCDDGEVDGMNGFVRENRSTRRTPDPTPLCPKQIPPARPGREPGPPQWEASDCFSYFAAHTCIKYTLTNEYAESICAKLVHFIKFAHITHK